MKSSSPQSRALFNRDGICSILSVSSLVGSSLALGPKVYAQVTVIWKMTATIPLITNDSCKN